MVVVLAVCTVWSGGGNGYVAMVRYFCESGCILREWKALFISIELKMVAPELPIIWSASLKRGVQECKGAI